MTSLLRLRALGVFIVGGATLFAFTAVPAATNVYVTQFETVEGYNNNLDLIGQLNWTGEGPGTGWNGLTEGFISDQGQHGYIGFAAPAGTNESPFVLWRPINFNAVAAGLPIVRFSVQMQVTDSLNGQYDDFRWSVYNSQGDRLFSLDFDNLFQDVNYLLDGTNKLVLTGIPLTNDVTYSLVVTMNFASNRWSAMLNSTLIATNQPITTVGSPLNLGDVDAVWIINDPVAAGDNLMVFDNYQITAEALVVPPPPAAHVQLLGRTTEGWALLRVFGQAESRWALEATTNFTHWTALKTNTVSSIFFDHVDNTAAGVQHRYYRARWVP